MIDRLGNMVLLETKQNSKIGNANWRRKQPILDKSQFTLTQRIARENQTWTPARLEQHQQWMAKQATAIWHIKQLS